MAERAQVVGAETHRNEVLLSGRLAAPPDPKPLPSGAKLLTFRLVVRRAAQTAPAAPGRRPVTTDTVDCVAWRGDVQRVASGWTVGDVVEVEGALRRRFWRGPGGVASRCEVEVARARRLRRAP